MRYFVVAMMLVATMAFAQVPEHGVYASTDTQLRNTGGGYNSMGSPVNCRIAYNEEVNMLGLLWDYDGDGLEDEQVETFRYLETDDGLVWQEDDITYNLFVDDGKHYLLMMFPGETWAIKMEKVD